MKKLLAILTLCVTSMATWALVPIQLTNQSQYADSQIYIGIIGQNVSRQQMYVNLAANSASNAAFTPLNTSLNTLHKKSGDWGYANIFVTLDRIPDKTIYVDMCYGCRLFVAFGSPMYLHAFDNGYAGADLNNPGDPNADLRWENIEFSYDENNVFFVNTTRVDAFQYPMGIDLYGDVAAGANNAHMRRGELQNYAAIINAWNAQYGATIYDQCKVNRITRDNLGPIIMQPSKIAAVKNANVFDSYINAIWSAFATKRLHASMGERGVWSGSVQNGAFVMTNDANPSQVAHIAKPTTTDVIEGAGTFASGSEIDKAVQAQFCGAMNRGMIMLNKADNELQNWGERSLFFTQNTWNEYVAFFHDPARSHEGYTYGFCYDDTFDQSATCATSHPSRLEVTIGGFAANPGEPVTPGDNNNDNENENDNDNDNGGTTHSGTTEQNLQWTCQVVQNGLDVTYTFAVSNVSDFVGLVPVIWDGSNGFREYINESSHTFTGCTVGQVLRVAAKWMFAGGDTHTDYIEYTVQEPSTTALESVSATPCATKFVLGGQLYLLRDGWLYDALGHRLK